MSRVLEIQFLTMFIRFTLAGTCRIDRFFTDGRQVREEQESSGPKFLPNPAANWGPKPRARKVEDGPVEQKRPRVEGEAEQSAPPT